MPAPSPQELAPLLQSFLGRTDSYAIQKEDGDYVGVKRKLTDALLLAHCKGQVTISAYTTNDIGNTPISMVDLDSKEPAAKELAIFIQDWLAHFNIPCFLEGSGKKGYHVWVVYKCFVPAAKAKWLLKIPVLEWQKETGIIVVPQAPGEKPAFGVEFNPKKTEPATLEKPGNCVKLPWGLHQVSKKRTCFLNGTLTPLEDWGLQAFQESRRITEADLDAILVEFPLPPPPPRAEGERPPTGYGLPCFAKMMEACPPHFRHVACFRMAVQMFRQGLSADRALDILLEWDTHNEPPHGREDIDAAVKSAYTGQYKLGCADIEAAGFCSEPCPVRKKRYAERDEKVTAPRNVKETVQEKTKAVTFETSASGNLTVKVNAPRLAEELMEARIYKTFPDTHELLVYEDGVYRSNAEAVAEEEIKHRLLDYNTVRRTAETIFNIKVSTFADRSEFERGGYQVVLQNGILDLQEGTLSPHNPAHPSTIKLPVRYEPNADCPRIRQFFSEVLHPWDQPVVEEFFGYCLEPSYFIHRAFLFIGDGANGKSTCIELLRTFLGKRNCATVSIQDFDSNRFSSSLLWGKLANLYADVPSTPIQNTGRFKMLTGGDTVGAEEKYRSGFAFYNMAKLLFSTNKPPAIKTEDSFAFWRRWILINFPNTFDTARADKRLLDKLTTPEELSGLLNVALEGLRRLWAHSDFTYSPSAEAVSQQYHEAASPIISFISTCCVTGSDMWVSKAEIYNAYCSFCQSRNLPMMGNLSFGRAMNNTPGLSVKSDRIRIDGELTYGWRGIKVGREDEGVVGGEEGEEYGDIPF